MIRKRGWPQAVAFLDFCLRVAPYFLIKNIGGIIMILIPPNSEQAGPIPRVRYIGRANSGCEEKKGWGREGKEALL